MDKNEKIISAVKIMAAAVSSILGTQEVETNVTINEEVVFDEKISHIA